MFAFLEEETSYITLFVVESTSAGSTGAEILGLVKGNLTLTGKALTQTFNIRRDLVSGSLALTGKTIAINALPTTLVKGSLTLVGKAVDVKIGEQFTLVKGNLNLIGHALVQLNRQLELVSGSLSLNGHFVILSATAAVERPWKQETAITGDWVEDDPL